jgi:hypothetical protein
MGKYEEEDEARDKTPELTKILPFMSEFPFTEYTIELLEKGDDLIQLGISPMLINEFGDTGLVETLNFYYLEGDSNISISIDRFDVSWIATQAQKVKVLDSTLKALNVGLDSSDLVEKARAAKVGKKFIKAIECEDALLVDSNELLAEFLNLYGTVLTSKLKMNLQKLSIATLKNTQFSERQWMAVTAYLNFQINYSKILLGIVIAAKIY